MTLPIVPPMGFPRGPMIGLPMHCNFLANTDRHTHTQNKALYINMAHRKVNSPEHLKNGDIFLEIPSKNFTNVLFVSFFLHILLIHNVKSSENIKFQFPGPI